jgi:hypothetical protein
MSKQQTTYEIYVAGDGGEYCDYFSLDYIDLALDAIKTTEDPEVFVYKIVDYADKEATRTIYGDTENGADRDFDELPKWVRVKTHAILKEALR